MEEDRSINKSLIRAEFVQSKRYPSYLMNLVNSEICDCDCCFSCMACDVNENHTIPVNDCSLPLYKSPLHEIASPKESNLELWELRPSKDEAKFTVLD